MHDRRKDAMETDDDDLCHLTHGLEFDDVPDDLAPLETQSTLRTSFFETKEFASSLENKKKALHLTGNSSLFTMDQTRLNPKNETKNTEIEMGTLLFRFLYRKERFNVWEKL